MTRPALALYQPDIPGNTGAILRLGACLGLDIHVIGPAGFDMTDRALKRAGMDYAEMAVLIRHDSWSAFEDERAASARRLILMTTKGAAPLGGFRFDARDIVLFGRESAGVPDTVHAAADMRLVIPMVPGRRSLNLAMSAAIAAGEIARAFPLPQS